MITTYKLFKHIERIDIEIIAANLFISTHDSRTVIIDHRKNITEELMPRVDCYEKHIHIHSQKISAFMSAKQLFRLKIIVPEHIELNCKLFSGSASLSGYFKKFKMHQRNGNCIVNTGFLKATENSSIENVLGSVELLHAQSNVQLDKSGLKATLTQSELKSKIQISAYSSAIRLVGEGE